MTRKIEEQMLAAIHARTAWRKGNTEVRCDAAIPCDVLLHGHLIACLQSDSKWMFNLCGWNTPTTRSRLNAICRDFVPRCIGIATKQGQARIAYRDGETGLRFVNVNSEGWFTV